MKQTIIIKIIAFLEALIGILTIAGLTAHFLLSLSKKSLNIFVFVFACAVLSTVLGLGIFARRHWARTLLIFFSGYIILTKVLIFSNIMSFNGEIITFIPAHIKNYISIIYHVFLIIFFNQTAVKKEFGD